MEFDLCWKYLVLSFSLLHLHYAYLQLKECMHSSTCFVFLHNKTFSKTPTILLKGIQKKNFDDEITRKIAHSNLNWLEFEHCKIFEVHEARSLHLGKATLIHLLCQV